MDNIKSIITGQFVKPGEFEYGWQQMVTERQEALEEKLLSVGLPVGCQKEAIEFSKIMKDIEDIIERKMFVELSNAIIYKQLTEPTCIIIRVFSMA